MAVLIGLMAVLLIVIFVGFLNHFRIMYFEDGESNDPDVRAVSAWCIAPDVAGDRSAVRHGALVAAGILGSLSGDRRSPWRFGCDGADAMNGTHARTLSPDDLRIAAEALLGAGGRIQFAYAWSPAEGQVEVRYVASVPDQRDFEMWVVKDARELPSLAAIFPLARLVRAGNDGPERAQVHRSSRALSAGPAKTAGSRS